MRIVAPHLGKLCRWSDRFIYKSEKFINEFSWSVIQQLLTLYKYQPSCWVKTRKKYVQSQEPVVSAINIINATEEGYTWHGGVIGMSDSMWAVFKNHDDFM